MNHLKLIKPVKTTFSFVENSEISIFNINSGFKGLVFKALKKLGWIRPKMEQVSTIETICIDTQQIFHFIIQQNNDIIGRFNMRESIVLMGSKNFYDLTKQVTESPFRFNLEKEFFTDGSRRVAGLIVCVLPWIDGCVLVPRQHWPIDVKEVKVRVAITPEEALDERERRAGI